MKHTIKCIIEYRNPLVVLENIDPPSSNIGLGYLSTWELLTPLVAEWESVSPVGKMSKIFKSC